MKKVLFLLFSFCVSPAFGSVTIDLDAGQLTGTNGAPMVADDNYPSSNGSLLLILDLGSSGVADNTLTPGNFVSGTDSILAAGGFNTNNGTNETMTAFNIPESVMSTLTPGSQLALRWFPQITLSEFESGTLPAANDYFGTYSPNGGNPDGGYAWTLPTDGSLISLDFDTSNTDLGGNEAPSYGLTNYQVIGAAPEPSNWMLLLFGIGLIVFVAQRRRLIRKRPGM